MVCRAAKVDESKPANQSSRFLNNHGRVVIAIYFSFFLRRSESGLIIEVASFRDLVRRERIRDIWWPF